MPGLAPTCESRQESVLGGATPPASPAGWVPGGTQLQGKRGRGPRAAVTPHSALIP